METFSSLFSAIGERFTGAAWFETVLWPFWACLTLVAIGGVYTACFRKNTLFCRGITGGLKLALIYLLAFSLYRLVPGSMGFVREFPLLDISANTLTLVEPFSLFRKPITDFPEVMAKLYCLLFTINACGSVDYGGRNKLPWVGSQFLSCLVAPVVYFVLGAFFVKLWSNLADISWLYLIISFLLLLPMTILMGMKLFFIVFRKAGNPTYTKIMQFLTAQPFGSLFSVTLFSMLAVLIFMVIINLWDMAEITIAAINPIAYTLIVFICGGTLLVYSMYFTERKAG